MAGRTRTARVINAVLEDDYADLFLRSPVSPKSLSEVKISTTYQTRIDDKIEELVKALILTGVKTIRSCEGHRYEHGSPSDSDWTRAYGNLMYGQRPWVETYHGPGIQVLRNQVAIFNQRSEIKWHIREVAPVLGLTDVDHILGLSTVSDAGDGLQLEKLQRSAGEFAQFIFASTGRQRTAWLGELQRKTASEKAL